MSKVLLITFWEIKLPLLNLYWTWYLLTPRTGCQFKNILLTALLSITTIFSSASKLLGAGFKSVRTVVVLVGSATPSSTKAYLAESCDKAVTSKVKSGFSLTVITLQ